MSPSDRLYTQTHEWAKALGNGVYQIGITDYAERQLGDVVYVDLPADGAMFAKAGAFGAVESVKAASEVYMPLSGTILASNSALSADPALVNKDAWRAGWFCEIKASDISETQQLLTAAQYDAQLE